MPGMPRADGRFSAADATWTIVKRSAPYRHAGAILLNVGMVFPGANSRPFFAHVSLVKNEPAKLLSAWQQNDNAPLKRCPIVACLLPTLNLLRGKVSLTFLGYEVRF
jgi:hypothetical protein